MHRFAAWRCQQPQRVIPAVAQEDIDVSSIFLCQHAIGQMLHQTEHRRLDSDVIAAEAHGLGGTDFQKARLKMSQIAQPVARRIRVGRDGKRRRVGHAGDEMIDAVKACQTLGRQIIGKGAVDPLHPRQVGNRLARCVAAHQRYRRVDAVDRT